MIACGFVPLNVSMQQQQMRYQERWPLGQCVKQLQLRSCLCDGSSDFLKCTEWAGSYKEVVCTPGCGDLAYGAARPLQFKEACNRTFARGEVCSGVEGKESDRRLKAFGWAEYEDQNVGEAFVDGPCPPARPPPQSPPPPPPSSPPSPPPPSSPPPPLRIEEQALADGAAVAIVATVLALTLIVASIASVQKWCRWRTKNESTMARS